MKIEQIYTGCLAQGAYYIHSAGEAIIIDPLREVQPYLDRAAADGVKIKYVLETHFHADFVSGHLDLSAKSGSKIVFGPTAKPNFEAHIAADGEILNVGKITIKVLHTPGHTMESVTYLLRDESGKDVAIFSGDTLFLGDVGRPDLAQKAASMTKEELAGLLYDSLRTKIMPLAAPKQYAFTLEMKIEKKIYKTYLARNKIKTKMIFLETKNNFYYIFEE